MWNSPLLSNLQWCQPQKLAQFAAPAQVWKWHEPAVPMRTTNVG
jgi:hypothetical protein